MFLIVTFYMHSKSAQIFLTPLGSVVIQIKRPKFGLLVCSIIAVPPPWLSSWWTLDDWSSPLKAASRYPMSRVVHRVCLYWCYACSDYSQSLALSRYGWCNLQKWAKRLPPTSSMRLDSGCLHWGWQCYVTTRFFEILVGCANKHT